MIRSEFVNIVDDSFKILLSEGFDYETLKLFKELVSLKGKNYFDAYDLKVSESFRVSEESFKDSICIEDLK